jgi:RNA polymerase sporulation-specific sigma factor
MKLSFRAHEYLKIPEVEMATYKVEICGVNTAALPLLNSKEKEELLKKIKEGDLLARDKFIHGNLRLVLSIAHRFSQSGEDVDDLFQIGCIGMIKAIDNFDISQNVQFSTYAVPMITGEIKRYLRDSTNPIRVSRSIKDTAYKALRARENLMKLSQKEPTITEIAEETGIVREDIVMALEAIQTPISIYEPMYTDGNESLCLCDQIRDKKDEENILVTNMSLRDALDKLASREREIINMRYFDGKTQMETAAELGISQAQVSRLEKCALRAMRTTLE